MIKVQKKGLLGSGSAMAYAAIIASASVSVHLAVVMVEL